MKALTSSCSSNSILGSPSPRVAVHVSDKLEFCFNLRSRNHKKSYNFWFLKLVQNKGIYPVVHAVPSKTQMDLDTVESDLETEAPQDQQNEQTNESKFVRVTFQLQKDCDFGEQFLIVGDDPILGSWDPSDALPMTWSDGHIWTVELDMPAGKSIQFKFILKGKGDIIWQPGSDRIIHTWETINRIIVCEDWENAELQKIIEEDQLAQSNEEPQVDSEMSTFTENLDNPEVVMVSNVSKISGIEDCQTLAEEKPLTEPDLQQITAAGISSLTEKPMAIVADNIGSSEDLIKSTRNKKKINLSEESADSPENDDIIHVFGHNGTAAPIKNPERTVVESNLFDFEGGPVLVPGLTPPVVPNEEAGPGEFQERTTMNTSIEAFESKDQNIPEGEAQERTSMDTSIEAFKSKDQNIPEFNKEQESDDGTPQEINATIIKNELELINNEYEEQSHLAPATEDRSNSQLVHGNALQNDIQWGRETVKKFLTKLGLLL